MSVKKEEDYMNIITNLDFYMLILLQSMNDEKFEKYEEFTILIHRPEFKLLPQNIKDMAISHCEKYFNKYGYD